MRCSGCRSSFRSSRPVSRRSAGSTRRPRWIWAPTRCARSLRSPFRRSVGLIVGALFAFVTSFDQVEVSLFLTRPRNNTLPIAMFNYEQNYQDPTLAAISAVLIGFTVVLVLIAVSLLKTQEYRRLIERG